MILLVTLFLALALKSSFVQTRLARGAAIYLSGQLNAEVQVEKLDFRPFNGFTLKGFLVKDQRSDTLLFAETLETEIEKLDFKKGVFSFEELNLTNAKFFLYRIDSAGTTNLDFLTDYFRTEEPTKDKSGSVSLFAESLNIKGSQFVYENLFGQNAENGIDFNNLKIVSINAQFSAFRAEGDSLKVDINQLIFEEQSGFGVKDFQSNLKIDSTGIYAHQLSLKTANSNIQGRIGLLHDSLPDYSEFMTSIEWDAEFSASQVDLQDIGYFTSGLYGVDVDLIVHGLINGPISNLNGRRMLILAGDRTVLRGDIDLTGLPDFENTFIDFRIGELRTDYQDLLNIGRALPIEESLAEVLPIEVDRAGDLMYNGFFTGFPQDFVTFGTLQTEAGSFGLDLNLERDTIKDGLKYVGALQANAVNAGFLFDVDSLGLVSGDFTVKAFSQETFEFADIQGTITEFGYRDYNYQDITLDGKLSKQRFSGSIRSDDPNVALNFKGLVDLSQAVPYYDFDAEIFNLNLTALNMVNLKQELSVMTNLSLDGRGSSIDNAAGKLVATQSLLCYGDSSVAMNDLVFTIYGDSINRKVSFDSDIVDISITGVFNPLELPDAFRNLVAEVMPSLAEPVLLDAKEVFQFSINYSTDNAITSLLIPGLKIDANTSLYGSFDSEQRKLELSFLSPGVDYGKFSVENISADMGKNGEIFKGRIFANNFFIDSLNFGNPDVDIEAYNDFIELKTGWFAATGNNSAELELHADFFSKDHFIVELEPGYFNIRDLRWDIDERAIFEKDSTSMIFDSFLIHSGEQTVILDGKIGLSRLDTIHFNIENFDLASLDSMGLGMQKDIAGLVNLKGAVSNFYESTAIEAEGDVENFVFGKRSIGNLIFSSAYQGDSEDLKINATLVNEGRKLVTFDGVYNTKGDDEMHGDLILDDFNLDILNELGIPQVSDFSGRADGQIQVEGVLAKPQLKGHIDFDKALFKIDYLNTYFVFDDRVRVEPDFFGIDYKPLLDSKGNKGFVVASAFHEDFANWSYDISADVNNFYILNTTREENKLYFGQAFATGSVQLGGYEGKLEVNIDATTEKGTTINLPLDENEEVALENFVHFVNEDRELDTEREVDLSGVSMRLNVDATPDALFRIIFDEKSGDILQGRGAGKISLETTESGEFNMFGRYEIFNGDYNFTLKSLISKRFNLRAGGTIGWYGDPYNADLDLSAVYAIRTPLQPIMIEDQNIYRSRELVNVSMALTGKLLTPSIGFEIELPQATENERTQLASAVSTVNQLNQQVFSLLILNKFIPIAAQDQAGTGVVSGVAAFTNTSTSEFISNQLSGWLSEISNEFDIGLNYRSGDVITNQEIAVALSTQLFDERLLVSGSFGVTQATDAQISQGQSGILGDFLLEYMLTKDGKIRLKVFNETNPYEVFSTSTSMYTQGVGLIYQEDFDTIDEFFRKVGELFKDDKAEEVP
ncbi:translocation/assembly module TamB domain-containing protein [Cryomorphaceae bacterium 1068]|nr:translocation/assembly module TamB domain-containing protein [Cryomorphaceae bacterium 1068]